MIDKEIVENLRKFLKTATPGPWEMHSNVGYCGIRSGEDGLFLDVMKNLVDDDKEGGEKDEAQYTHCPYWEKKLHERDVESYKKEIETLKKENVELKNKLGKIKGLF